MSQVSDYYVLSLLKSAMMIRTDLSLAEIIVAAGQAAGRDSKELSSCSNKDISEGLHKVLMED